MKSRIINGLDYDVSKTIEPFKGNTIITSIDVVFRRKVPSQNVPHWIKEREMRAKVRSGEC